MGSLKSALRLLRRLIAPALLAFSLFLNIALFFSSSVYGLAASAVELVSGRKTLAARQADEIATVHAHLNEERRLRREAQSGLAQANADLLAERQMKRELRSELADASELLAVSRANRKRVQDAAGKVAERVSQRAKRTAVREVVSMPGEAIPIYGAAVIATATALEIKDLCQTLIDMTELQQLFDPSATPSEEQLTVCSLEVPPREVIWQTAMSAPGEAWDRAMSTLPDLEDVRSFEMDAVDWAGMGQFLSDRAGAMATSTADAVQRKWMQFQNWQE